MFALEVICGPEAGLTFEVPSGGCIIGRITAKEPARTNALMLLKDPSRNLSKHHAVVEYDAVLGRWILKDTSSSGTWVSATGSRDELDKASWHPVKQGSPAALRAGLLLKFGKSTIIAVLDRKQTVPLSPRNNRTSVPSGPVPLRTIHPLMPVSGEDTARDHYREDNNENAAPSTPRTRPSSARSSRPSEAPGQLESTSAEQARKEQQARLKNLQDRLEQLHKQQDQNIGHHKKEVERLAQRQSRSGGSGDSDADAEPHQASAPIDAVRQRVGAPASPVREKLADRLSTLRAKVGESPTKASYPALGTAASSPSSSASPAHSPHKPSLVAPAAATARPSIGSDVSTETPDDSIDIVNGAPAELLSHPELLRQHRELNAIFMRQREQLRVLKEQLDAKQEMYRNRLEQPVVKPVTGPVSVATEIAAAQPVKPPVRAVEAVTAKPNPASVAPRAASPARTGMSAAPAVSKAAPTAKAAPVRVPIVSTAQATAVAAATAPARAPSAFIPPAAVAPAPVPAPAPERVFKEPSFVREKSRGSATASVPPSPRTTTHSYTRDELPSPSPSRPGNLTITNRSSASLARATPSRLELSDVGDIPSDSEHSDLYPGYAFRQPAVFQAAPHPAPQDEADEYEIVPVVPRVPANRLSVASASSVDESKDEDASMESEVNNSVNNSHAGSRRTSRRVSDAHLQHKQADLQNKLVELINMQREAIAQQFEISRHYDELEHSSIASESVKGERLSGGSNAFNTSVQSVIESQASLAAQLQIYEQKEREFEVDRRSLIAAVEKASNSSESESDDESQPGPLANRADAELRFLVARSPVRSARPSVAVPPVPSWEDERSPNLSPIEGVAEPSEVEPVSHVLDILPPILSKYTRAKANRKPASSSSSTATASPKVSDAKGKRRESPAKPAATTTTPRIPTRKSVPTAPATPVGANTGAPSAGSGGASKDGVVRYYYNGKEVTKEEIEAGTVFTSAAAYPSATPYTYAGTTVKCGACDSYTTDYETHKMFCTGR